MTIEPIRHPRRPCGQCPWRRDTPAGKFPAHRYAELAATNGTPGHEATLTAPIFACHLSPQGHDQACAGWLAVVGLDHLGIRLATAAGRLDPAALRPGPDWPPLFDGFANMVEHQAG